MTEVKVALVSNFDIFIFGIFIGGLLVIVCGQLQKWSEFWLNKKQIELDSTLGRALIKMREELK